VVDQDGTAKACTQRAYPLPIAMQMAWAVPLPVYQGAAGTLMEEIMAQAAKKAEQVPQLPEV